MTRHRHRLPPGWANSVGAPAPGTAATRTWAFLLPVALMGGGAAAGAPLGGGARLPICKHRRQRGPLATDDQYLWSQPAVNNAGTVAFVALDEGGARSSREAAARSPSWPPVPAASLHSTGRSRLTTTAHSPSRAGVDVRDPTPAVCLHRRGDPAPSRPSRPATSFQAASPYVPPQRHPSFRSGVGLDRHDAVTFMMDPDGETRASSSPARVAPSEWLPTRAAPSRPYSLTRSMTRARQRSEDRPTATSACTWQREHRAKAGRGR